MPSLPPIESNYLQSSKNIEYLIINQQVMNYMILGAAGELADVVDVIAKLKELGAKYNSHIQLFDANFIFGRDHLESAVLHAERAFDNNSNLAGDPSIEILLYASGERQIKQAIDKLGIKKGLREFGMVIYVPRKNETTFDLEEVCNKTLTELGLARDDSVLNGGREVLERFGIPGDEIDMISESRWGNLILSRVAMVDIIK
jgi:KEOPS complex subunit Cgi121